MRTASTHQGQPVRMVVLIAALAMLVLAAGIFGGAFIARAQAQDGSMGDPTLTSDTAGTIVVSWQIPNPEPSDYRLDWAKSGESYTSWTDNDGHLYPPGTATSATITGLDAGVDYKVRIRARYNAGQYADEPWRGDWTGDVLVTVASDSQESNGPTPVPGIINGLSASSPDPGTLRGTWDMAAPNPSDYRVLWHKSGDPVPTWKDHDHNAYTSAENHTITGLEEDTSYRVLVRSRYQPPVHDPSWSGPFANITARTSYSAPGQPTSLTASAVPTNRPP